MPKKRANGDGGLYWLPNRKLWRGVIDVGYWPDGRRKQASRTGRTQAIARARLDKLKAESVKYGAPLDRTVTVEIWSKRWLETVQKPSMKPNGYAGYESVMRTWIVPVLRTRRVADLKPSDVRAVVRNILDSGRSTGTARKTYNVLSGMLEAARKEGLAERNVAADVTPPEVRAKERGALSTEQALSVLQAALSYVDGTRWWVALLSGLRQSERLGARLDSLDLAAGTYDVEWALDEIPSEHGCAIENGVPSCGMKRGADCPQGRLKIPDGFDYIHLHGRLALIRPKSGKVRQVPLVPELVDALDRYLAATADWPNPYGLIWRKPTTGEPYLPGEDQQIWRDVLHAAQVITAEQAKPPKDREAGTPEPPTTHWARHTTATILMELGVDARIVGEIVGHVDPKTTRGYQHVSSAAARAAMNALGAHLSLAPTPNLGATLPTVGGPVVS